MGIPIGEWSGSDTTDQLRESIEKDSRTSRRLAVAALVVATLALGVSVWQAVDDGDGDSNTSEVPKGREQCLIYNEARVIQGLPTVS